MSTQHDAIVQHQFAVEAGRAEDYGKHSPWHQPCNGFTLDDHGFDFDAPERKDYVGRHRCTETTPCLHVITPGWGDAPSYMKWVQY